MLELGVPYISSVNDLIEITLFQTSLIKSALFQIYIDFSMGLYFLQLLSETIVWGTSEMYFFFFSLSLIVNLFHHS